MKNTLMKILLGMTILSSLFLCGLLYLLARKGKGGGEKVTSALEEYQKTYNTTNKDQKTIYPQLFMDFSAEVPESELYSTARHTEIRDRMDSLQKAETYTEDNPLLIYDPYGLNSMSMYVYFQTEHPERASYRISATESGNPIFAAEVDSEDQFLRTHEFLMIGLAQNCENRITLSLTDAAGNVTIRTFYITTKPMHGDWRSKMTASRGTSETELSDGLYAVCGNAVDGKEAILFYDNDGVLRSEILLSKPGCKGLLMIDNLLYFNCSENEFAALDCFLQLQKKFTVQNYTIENTFCISEDKKKLLFPASKIGEPEKGVCDKVLSLSLEDGETSELLDMGKLLPEYKAMCETEEDGRLNYININSIAELQNDSLLLCSRELSALIKVEHVSEQPAIAYLIGEPLLLSETGLDSKLLLKNGTFPSFFGPGDLAVQREANMPKEAYYVTLFDHHIAGTKSRPELSYAEAGQNLGSSMKKGEASFFVRYLVNEKEGSFEQLENVALPYSGYYGNNEITQDGNRISVCSGRLSFQETDAKNQVIKSFTSTGGESFTCVHKLPLSGYWFAEKTAAVQEKSK